MAIISAQIKTTNTDILDPSGAGSPAGAVPTGKTYAITNILVCNNSTSAAATFDMHLVKSGYFNITNRHSNFIYLYRFVEERVSCSSNTKGGSSDQAR